VEIRKRSSERECTRDFVSEVQHRDAKAPVRVTPACVGPRALIAVALIMLGEAMQFFSAVDIVQFQFFAVATLVAAGLFSMGFLLGRVSRRAGSVKVPLEVIHALASARGGFSAARMPAHAKGVSDAVVHEVEAILDHVRHEKDFKKAQTYTLHELERVEHDHGASPELTELHGKVEHAHDKHEIEVALEEFIEHAKH
jgi:hypothetical protein